MGLTLIIIVPIACHLLADDNQPLVYLDYGGDHNPYGGGGGGGFDMGTQGGSQASPGSESKVCE